MRNLTIKLGAGEDSEDDLLKTFEFEKELAKVSYWQCKAGLSFPLPLFFFFDIVLNISMTLETSFFY